MSEEEKLSRAVGIIESRTDLRPQAGIVLGSGMGALIEQIEEEQIIPFKEIPYFPLPSVKGHPGNLVLGRLGGKPVIVMQGRVHYYESQSMDEIAFTVRFLGKTGIRKLMLTNACGAINSEFRSGSFMFIRDHINWMGTNPLIGPNLDGWGPRFPDMTNTYDRRLTKIGLGCARSLEMETFSGVYCSVTGPYYFSRAELNVLRFLGADAIGMSTIPEAIVARHMGLPVLGISCITDMAVPETLTPLTHEEVVRAAEQAAPSFIRLITAILQQLQ